jgi:predicted glycoside hydrolase/deacetylase ChbG (UPF0249 family)
MQTRTIILCADDYGADAWRDDAIVELAAAGRISATTCFADSPSWPAAAARLKALPAGFRVGLHFNLTRPFGYGERPLGWWLTQSALGGVDVRAVRAHLERQAGALEAALGRPPDFIDGHEHVHAFPGVRAALRGFALAEAERGRAVRVRALAPPFGHTDAPFKRRVIQRIATLRGAPGAAPAPLNSAFGGDYSLRANADFGALMADWLRAAPEGALLMCHPGAGEAASATARREFEFLRSERFAQLLAAARIELDTTRPVSPGHLV